MKKTKKAIKLLILFISIFILGNIGLYVYCLITPKVELNKNQSIYFYDNNNELIFNNENNWISIDKISNYLIDATLATEDKHFYKHLGFDYLRILKATLTNIKNKKLSEGASTITQQYARNLFLNYEKSWGRKLEEALLACELETHYTKNEILEGYLNTINYGGVYGIENASYYYFNKSSSELNLAEATMLAGIPQSPSNYSPINNLDKAEKRQKTVLKLMLNNNYIEDVEYKNVINTNLKYYGKFNNETNINSIMYYKDSVLDELNSINSIPKSLIETGGLKIYTTLDKKAQNDLEEAVNKNLDNNELQLSGIMMNPENGEVLALIGGNNYNNSEYNRALHSKRQVGSTIKPFLYYTALENGFTSASSFTSSLTTFNFSSNKTYTPKNYNNVYANGPISMGAAIAYSDNVYAVKTHLFLGENALINTANRIGITSSLDEIPSLALGSNEISLIEMVTGYSSLANQGYRIKSHFIRKIEDNKGNILYKYNDEKESTLNPSITYILSEMLTYTYDTDFIDYNYPTVISLLPKMTNKYAIKTGTTDTDMWIMGYNKNAVLGIWSGYDDNRKMESKDNIYHKNIWIDTMENFLKDKDNSWYEPPENIVGILVNPITGNLATENDKKSKIFYFIKGTEPNINNSNELEEVFKEENNIIEE